MGTLWRRLRTERVRRRRTDRTADRRQPRRPRRDGAAEPTLICTGPTEGMQPKGGDVAPVLFCPLPDRAAASDAPLIEPHHTGGTMHGITRRATLLLATIAFGGCAGTEAPAARSDAQPDTV